MMIKSGAISLDPPGPMLMSIVTSRPKYGVCQAAIGKLQHRTFGLYAIKHMQFPYACAYTRTQNRDRDPRTDMCTCRSQGDSHAASFFVEELIRVLQRVSIRAMHLQPRVENEGIIRYHKDKQVTEG